MSLFTVAVPVLNQFQATEECLQTWIDLAKDRFHLLLIDNGSGTRLEDQSFIERWKTDCNLRVVRNEKNTGVFPTFQQIYDLTDTDYIFYTHSDVKMLEYGWDERLTRILYELMSAGKRPGVCGMFGAKGIGTPDIYKAPYHFTQLMRWDCWTVPAMEHAGSKIVQSNYEHVVVLDGFSLIVSRAMVMLAMTGQFDCSRYPAHHNYDNDICLESHFAGFNNFVIDINCKHLGGVTSVQEKWAEAMGATDLAIHRQAHRVMYEKFRNRLPTSVA